MYIVINLPILIKEEGELLNDDKVSNDTFKCGKIIVALQLSIIKHK